MSIVPPGYFVEPPAAVIERLTKERDDLLAMLKVRNEALNIAAEYAHPGPDGQDYLDRSRLVARWLKDAYEELGIAQGEPMVPAAQPKPSLLAWVENAEDLVAESRVGDLMDALAKSLEAAKEAHQHIAKEETHLVMLCLEDDETAVCYLPLGHEGPHEFEARQGSRYCVPHHSMEEEPSGRCYRWLHSDTVAAAGDCGFIDATCEGCPDGPCNPWCDRKGQADG
jgi:hypothetical protein